MNGPGIFALYFEWSMQWNWGNLSLYRYVAVCRSLYLAALSSAIDARAEGRSELLSMKIWWVGQSIRVKNIFYWSCIRFRRSDVVWGSHDRRGWFANGNAVWSSAFWLVVYPQSLTNGWWRFSFFVLIGCASSESNQWGLVFGSASPAWWLGGLSGLLPLGGGGGLMQYVRYSPQQLGVQ